MKKLWHTGLCFLLIVSLAACTAAAPQGPSAPPGSSENQTAAPAETPDIQPSSPPSQLPEETPEPSAEVSEHILIAYFSMVDVVPDGADAVTHATASNGNTRTAALEIHAQMGGDLFQIQTSREYPVGHRDCSAIAEEEIRSDARPPLTSQVEDMDRYDVIFLGFPIWWYTSPMVVRTFLEAYDFSGKTIVPFCTSMGVDADQSVDEIRELCPGANVLDGLTLHTGRADEMPESISTWLDQLGLS